MSYYYDNFEQDAEDATREYLCDLCFAEDENTCNYKPEDSSTCTLLKSKLREHYLTLRDLRKQRRVHGYQREEK